MKLTKNFSLHEFTKSPVADRFGIKNTPSQKVIENLKSLCENLLQPLRDAVGPIIITSGYRCLELNRKIGSRDDSDHVGGYAADFESLELSNYDLAKYIVDNLKFKQLILEFYDSNDPHSGWVHCSYKIDSLSMDVRRTENGVLYVKGIG